MTSGGRESECGNPMKFFRRDLLTHPPSPGQVVAGLQGAQASIERVVIIKFDGIGDSERR